jgi:hypothetical protein
MTSVSLPERRAEAPGRHLWIVVGFALLVGAGAGG